MSKAWVVQKTIYYVCSEDVTNEEDAIAEADAELLTEWQIEEGTTFATIEEISDPLGPEVV